MKPMKAVPPLKAMTPMKAMKAMNAMKAMKTVLPYYTNASPPSDNIVWPPPTQTKCSQVKAAGCKEVARRRKKRVNAKR